MIEALVAVHAVRPKSASASHRSQGTEIMPNQRALIGTAVLIRAPSWHKLPSLVRGGAVTVDGGWAVAEFNRRLAR
jgi:hypothetical protein